MSGFTGTMTELLHSWYGPAAPSVPSTAAVTITANPTSPAGYFPEIVVPAGYMSATGKRSSSLKLEIGGYMTATATVPTFSFGLANQVGPGTSGFSAATPLCTISNTVTPSAASGSWDGVFSIGLRTLGQLNTSTVWCSGKITASPALTASQWWMNPLGGGGTTCTAWQSDQEFYIYPYLTLGAATAGNTVTVSFVRLYGEN